MPKIEVLYKKREYFVRESNVTLIYWNFWYNTSNTNTNICSGEYFCARTLKSRKRNTPDPIRIFFKRANYEGHYEELQLPSDAKTIMVDKDVIKSKIDESGWKSMD